MGEQVRVFLTRDARYAVSRMASAAITIDAIPTTMAAVNQFVLTRQRV